MWDEESGSLNLDDYSEQELKTTDFSLDILNSHADRFSDIYSEGSPGLKELLQTLWKNEIRTVGCCIGHKDRVEYGKKKINGEFLYIDEAEYLKHRLNPFYKKLIHDSSPYFAYYPVAHNAIEKQMDIIQDNMQKRMSEANLFLGIGERFTGEQFITIIHKGHLDENKRELFFQSLKDVFENCIMKQKEATVQKKHSFTEIVSASEIKKQKQEKQHERFIQEPVL